ncbi:MAG TPA: hypothetical protein VEA59_05795 [Patescibacteria group bacterium]|nr:hypothetical protein [Patescibacteria group bacterium]
MAPNFSIKELLADAEDAKQKPGTKVEVEPAAEQEPDERNLEAPQIKLKEVQQVYGLTTLNDTTGEAARLLRIAKEHFLVEEGLVASYFDTQSPVCHIVNLLGKLDESGLKKLLKGGKVTFVVDPTKETKNNNIYVYSTNTAKEVQDYLSAVARDRGLDPVILPIQQQLQPLYTYYLREKAGSPGENEPATAFNYKAFSKDSWLEVGFRLTARGMDKSAVDALLADAEKIKYATPLEDDEAADLALKKRASELVLTAKNLQFLSGFSRVIIAPGPSRAVPDATNGNTLFLNLNDTLEQNQRYLNNFFNAQLFRGNARAEGPAAEALQARSEQGEGGVVSFNENRIVGAWRFPRTARERNELQNKAIELVKKIKTDIQDAELQRKILSELRFALGEVEDFTPLMQFEVTVSNEITSISSNKINLKAPDALNQKGVGRGWLDFLKSEVAAAFGAQANTAPAPAPARAGRGGGERLRQVGDAAPNNQEQLIRRFPDLAGKLFADTAADAELRGNGDLRKDFYHKLALILTALEGEARLINAVPRFEIDTQALDASDFAENFGVLDNGQIVTLGIDGVTQLSTADAAEGLKKSLQLASAARLQGGSS